jgi:hypothetical protein
MIQLEAIYFLQISSVSFSRESLPAWTFRPAKKNEFPEYSARRASPSLGASVSIASLSDKMKNKTRAAARRHK